MTVATGSIVGCADENAAETWVKRLDDPATTPAAVNRIVQFFEDAMTRDNKDRNGPTVKPLLDVIMEPMTKKCVSGDIDERTNSKLIKFISDARDPRGAPCLIKALKDYKPESTEEDVRWAARAVGAMKLKEGAGPLLEVFMKVRHSKPKSFGIYRDVYEAVKAVNDPSWEGQLITMLGRPINDPKDVPNLRDELFWQITSAELLGLQKSEKAIQPLLKMLLSPSKAQGHVTAILALVKIGKPAVQPVIDLLESSNKELVEYSKIEQLKAAGDKPSSEQKKAAEIAHISQAALMLGTIGRSDSATPLLTALGKSTDDVAKAIIARELSKVPESPETVKAFQEIYEKVPATLTIPPGIGAREALLEASGSYFDEAFVPWIVKTALEAKGEEGDVAPIRDASLQVAMKLMTLDQIAEVDKLYTKAQTGADGKPSTVGKAFEKEYKMAKDLLNECKSDAACYLAKASDPANQQKDTQFKGIKAAYMLGVLGKPEIRQQIVDAMPKLTHAAIRFVSVSVIDHLSPQGDNAIAQKLQAIVDEAEEKRNEQLMSANAPFKTVIYRLNARSQ
ncbi:MAG TPA: HEAT repeat domain-containing protein [Candidatus Nanopelagicales bacterium]|nr:HEAT repeat domain-containing protein [Candidatus Nanopelagicales bacterium]